MISIDNSQQFPLSRVRRLYGLYIFDEKSKSSRIQSYFGLVQVIRGSNVTRAFGKGQRPTSSLTSLVDDLTDGWTGRPTNQPIDIAGYGNRLTNNSSPGASRFLQNKLQNMFESLSQKEKENIRLELDLQKMVTKLAAETQSNMNLKTQLGSLQLADSKKDSNSNSTFFD